MSETSGGRPSSPKPRPDFAKGALLPVIVQDLADGTVVMLAWANEAAFEATQRTGEAHFWSRSRGELWRKGATSGNTMRVVSLAVDCDADAILYHVLPSGPACHTGQRSCFNPPADAPGSFSLAGLERIVAERRSADPSSSYTARLLAGGARRPAEKLVEEGGELAAAALAGPDDEVVAEAADLLYHALVLLASRDLSLAQVESALAARHEKR